jgi:carbon monoxide dehydrogenase subunit G
LAPTFAASTVFYTVNVENSVSSISVSGVANHSAATVSGSVSDQVLSVGNNTVTLTVTAENGATQTYTILVVRAAPILSSDATLSGITVSAGTLSPAFAASTVFYTVNVENSVSSISITGTANHSAATVSGNVSNQALSVGNTTITLTVTAENGAQQAYIALVVRAAAIDDPPTAVASAQDYGVKVYPNPVVDKVVVESATDIREVEVFAAQGLLQLHVKPQATRVSLSLSALPAGVYVLRITNGQGVCVSKIVKQ